MKTKNLLLQINHLESLLDRFSLEALNAKEAFLLRKSFQSFKERFIAHTAAEKSKRPEELSDPKKEAKLRLHQSLIDEYPLQHDLDMVTYDAIIEHYNSYGAVLKSLKIESAMKTGNRSAFLVNESSFRTDNKPIEIDLNPILEDCVGDYELLKELVLLFEKNALEFIGAAKIHLRNTDFTQLELAAHKIKTGLAMMQTDDLHAIIVQIQHCCKTDQDIKHLEFLCECFTVEYPLVKTAIDEAVDFLQKK